MHRPREEAGDRRLLHDLAGVHHRHRVAVVRHHRQIPGHQERRRSLASNEVPDQVQNLDLDGDVETERRLVGDQEARVVGERHRDHDALGHAPAELVRVRGHALRR